MDNIIVQPLSSLDDLQEVEALQRTIWGARPDGIVPVHQLLAATSAGGVVLGARIPGGPLVGFAYGFVGLREDRVLFYSHMTGVQRDHRGANLGFRLKCAQRDFALAQGIDRIVWTFDPIVSANGYFNLHKLGATAQRYYVNYYGEMTDELNRGLPSDRLEVDWWLCSPRVESALRGAPQGHRWEDSVPALLVRIDGPMLVPEPAHFELTPTLIRIELPLSVDVLKFEHSDLARRWREATRDVFVHYFSRGYRAVDLLRAPASGDTLGAYILMRTSDKAQ